MSYRIDVNGEWMDHPRSLEEGVDRFLRRLDWSESGTGLVVSFSVSEWNSEKQQHEIKILAQYREEGHFLLSGRQGYYFKRKPQEIPVKDCGFVVVGQGAGAYCSKQELINTLTRWGVYQHWKKQNTEHYDRLNMRNGYKMQLNAPWEINGDLYYHFLEVLPPIKWRGSSFCLSEMHSQNRTTRYWRDETGRYMCEWVDITKVK